MKVNRKTGDNGGLGGGGEEYGWPEGEGREKSRERTWSKRESEREKMGAV